MEKREVKHNGSCEGTCNNSRYKGQCDGEVREYYMYRAGKSLGKHWFCTGGVKEKMRDGYLLEIIEQKPPEEKEKELTPQECDRMVYNFEHMLQRLIKGDTRFLLFFGADASNIALYSDIIAGIRKIKEAIKTPDNSDWESGPNNAIEFTNEAKKRGGTHVRSSDNVTTYRKPDGELIAQWDAYNDKNTFMRKIKG